MKKYNYINRINNIFNVRSNVIFKTLIILGLLFIVEYLIWIKLNYHHKPNEIALGNFMAFIIFIGTCITLGYLISKGYDKFATILIIHIMGLFFIDRITLEQGGKRYLDSKQDTWEFYQDNMKYMVMRNKEFNDFTIYKPSPKYSEDELYNPILIGKYIEVDNGWQMINDSLTIKIQNNKIIGFPTLRDTQVLRKIYF